MKSIVLIFVLFILQNCSGADSTSLLDFHDPKECFFPNNEIFGPQYRFIDLGYSSRPERTEGYFELVVEFSDIDLSEVLNSYLAEVLNSIEKAGGVLKACHLNISQGSGEASYHDYSGKRKACFREGNLNNFVIDYSLNPKKGVLRINRTPVHEYETLRITFVELA